MYYVLAQPETLSKLCRELEGAIPDPTQLPALTVLEQLPYLICFPLKNYMFPANYLLTAQQSMKVSGYRMVLAPVLNEYHHTSH